MQGVSAVSVNSLCVTVTGSHRHMRMHAKQLLQRRSKSRQTGSVQRCMAFDVTLVTPEGKKTIQCDESTAILDAADEAGLDLPYSCRSGSCGTCAAKLESGDMSQISQVSYEISPSRAATLYITSAHQQSCQYRTTTPSWRTS